MRTKEELIAAYDAAGPGSLLPVTEEEMDVLDEEIKRRGKLRLVLVDECFEDIIEINRKSQKSSR